MAEFWTSGHSWVLTGESGVLNSSPELLQLPDVFCLTQGFSFQWVRESSEDLIEMQILAAGRRV